MGIALLTFGLAQTEFISAIGSKPAPSFGIQSFDDYIKFIKNSNLPVVVKFWRPSCPACSQYSGPYNKVANNQMFDGKVIFIDVNTSQQLYLARGVGIRSVPHTFYYKDGVEVFRQGGAVSEEALTANIQNYLLN